MLIQTHLPCLERSRVLTAVTCIYRGAPLTDISLNWPIVRSVDCLTTRPIIPAVLPPSTRLLPRLHSHHHGQGGLQHSIAGSSEVYGCHTRDTVSVNKMDTVVLMVTIWPNLAKGTMTQKRRGTVEIAVVTVLDTMATPTWLTASRVHLCFSRACSYENRTV